MAAPFVQIHDLVTDETCDARVRELRWPEKILCPDCDSDQVVRRGRHDNQRERRRYHCRTCDTRFDDRTDTVFAGHHQPVKMWMLCVYFMGLNLSNAQISQELSLNADDIYHMTRTLRNGVNRQKNRPLDGPSRMRRGLHRCRAHRLSRSGAPTKSQRSSPQRGSRSRHAGQRKAPDLWYD